LISYRCASNFDAPLLVLISHWCAYFWGASILISYGCASNLKRLLFWYRCASFWYLKIAPPFLRERLLFWYFIDAPLILRASCFDILKCASYFGLLFWCLKDALPILRRLVLISYRCASYLRRLLFWYLIDAPLLRSFLFDTL
jgi:hypothetical protein